MKTKKPLLYLAPLALAVALLLPLAAQFEHHPALRQADAALRQARAILVQRAAHDFHGHRVAAIKHIDAALAELRAAAASDRN